MVYPVSGEPVPYYVLCLAHSIEFPGLRTKYVLNLVTLLWKSLIIAAVFALHDLLPHFATKHVVYEKKKLQTVSVHPSNPHSTSSIYLYRRAIVILTITGVIFRSELALLVGSHAFYLLIQRRISLDPFQDILPYGLLGLFIGVAISVPIDSCFWQHFPLWPELNAFIYNAIEGKATEWGIAPFHFYFSSALPRLLFNPLIYYLCIPVTVFIRPLRKPARDILFPNLFFIFLYSFQPHKERRFIIYAIPPLLAVAAAGASWIWTRRAKSLTYRFLSLCLVASTLASFGANFAMLAMSRLNYPGGEAINRLHSIADGKHQTVSVHMDTLSCMTGFTRFQEKPVFLNVTPRTIWRYDKTEDAETLLDPVFWQQFDYVLANNPERVIGEWEIEETVDGYAGLSCLRPGQPLEQDGQWEYDGADSPLRRYLRIRNFQDVKREAQLARQQVKEIGQHSVRQFRTGELKRRVLEEWKRVQGLGWQEAKAQAQAWAYENARRYLTGGWWVKARMEPMIRILKKQSR